MVAESCTKEAIALEVEAIQRMKRELRGLFMSSINTAADPAARVENAQEKIAEAQNYLSELRKRYQPEECPNATPEQKASIQALEELFVELEASCENAEISMKRFESVYLRRISHSHFD